MQEEFKILAMGDWDNNEDDEDGEDGEDDDGKEGY